MKRSNQASQARRALDRRFRQADFDSMLIRPRSGWIRAIREALGMSQAALASRLHISGSAVTQLEQAEISGRITLAKLENIAAALDSSVVYALVPNSSLEETVRRQARQVASAQLGYVANTMALEDQDVPEDQRASHLEVYADELIARNDVWRSRRTERSGGGEGLRGSARSPNHRT